MAQFAVIGLGSFGATVALELMSLNHDVIGIDSIKKNVENIENTLKTIAKSNDKDMYEILLLMMKLHVEKNSSSPLYQSSCNMK